MFVAFVWAVVMGTVGVAAADPAVQLTYTITADGKTCSNQGLTPVAAGGTQAFVSVVAPAAATVVVKDGGAVVSADSGLYKIAVDGKPHSVVVTWTAAGTNGTCGDPIDPTTNAATTSPSMDLAATTWLKSQSATSTSPRKAPRGTVFLFHLPSGQPAFPFPAKLTEGTDVQVVILVTPDKPHTLSLSITGCADTTPFRTTIVPTDGTKDALAKDQPFVAVPVGQYFSCGAGATSYTLKQDDQPLATTTITFRPKYTVAAIASLGWDTGRRVTYSANMRAGSSETTVLRSKDHVGIEDYIGAVWMIGGVDFEHFRWWNYFANLFVAVDPANPTKDVVAGFAITPTGGISLAIGMSFHQGQVLDGITNGDPVTGAVPSHASWNESGRGLFLGLTVDSRLYDAIVAKFKN